MNVLLTPLSSPEIERLVDAYRERKVEVGTTEARAIAALAELVARRESRPFPGIRVSTEASVLADREREIEALAAGMRKQEAEIERLTAELGMARRACRDKATLESRVERARAVLMGEDD